MPDETGGQVPIVDGIGLFRQDSAHPAGGGSDGGAVRRDGDLEWYQRARAEVGLGHGEDILESAENVAQVVDPRRWPANTVEIEGDVA